MIEVTFVDKMKKCYCLDDTEQKFPLDYLLFVC